MAHGAGKHKEMEHRVHVFVMTDGIKHSSGDVHHALSYYPCDGGWGHTGHQRLESDKHAEPHSHESQRL